MHPDIAEEPIALEGLVFEHVLPSSHLTPENIGAVGLLFLLDGQPRQLTRSYTGDFVKDPEMHQGMLAMQKKLLLYDLYEVLSVHLGLTGAVAAGPGKRSMPPVSALPHTTVRKSS